MDSGKVDIGDGTVVTWGHGCVMVESPTGCIFDSAYEDDPTGCEQWLSAARTAQPTKLSETDGDYHDYFDQE